MEGGVKYARNLVFRPRLAIKSWAALNAAILTELEADLPLRHLDDGRSAQEALALERQHLRALPEHLPATCRVVARVADKFGHVRVDHVTYSVPIRHAYRPAWVKLYHDRVAIAVGAEVVAQHRRVFCRGAKVLDAFHVLPLLERKHRAVAEATALADWRLAPVWEQVRAELAKHTRKPDQEWVRMLRLMETHPAAAVERAVAAALEQLRPRALAPRRSAPRTARRSRHPRRDLGELWTARRRSRPAPARPRRPAAAPAAPRTDSAGPERPEDRHGARDATSRRACPGISGAAASGPTRETGRATARRTVDADNSTRPRPARTPCRSVARRSRPRRPGPSHPRPLVQVVLLAPRPGPGRRRWRATAGGHVRRRMGSRRAIRARVELAAPMPGGRRRRTAGTVP